MDGKLSFIKCDLTVPNTDDQLKTYETERDCLLADTENFEYTYTHVNIIQRSERKCVGDVRTRKEGMKRSQPTYIDNTKNSNTFLT